MASRAEQTTKATIKVDITSEATKNITLNNINPAITDSVFGAQMLAVAGLQSHSLNTLTRENKYTVVSD